MTSLDAGYDRAAVLKQAARRNHFVSRIEKYEAKVKQDLKARGLLREQRTPITQHQSAISGRRVGVSEQKASLTGKAVPKKSDAVLEHKTCQSGEREDSPEQKIISEQREICTQPRSVEPDKGGATTSSTPVHPGKVHAVETKALTGVRGQALTEFKPSAEASELNVAATAVALKIRLKAADMSPRMQEHAFRVARECLNSLDKLHCKRVAYALKKEFDKTYGPAWHCIVGTSFGSYVTHSLGGFIYFSMDKVSVLLFKTTVEPVEH